MSDNDTTTQLTPDCVKTVYPGISVFLRFDNHPQPEREYNPWRVTEYLDINTDSEGNILGVEIWDDDVRIENLIEVISMCKFKGRPEELLKGEARKMRWDPPPRRKREQPMTDTTSGNFGDFGRFGTAPVEPMLQFFNYEHLPRDLAAVSEQFARLAHHIVDTVPRNPERTVALRKLLEAKDCAVRAVIYT